MIKIKNKLRGKVDRNSYLPVSVNWKFKLGGRKLNSQIKDFYNELFDVCIKSKLSAETIREVLLGLSHLIMLSRKEIQNRYLSELDDNMRNPK